MRATIMHGAGDVRVENVPDPVIQNPTGAICGSDLHPYHGMPASRQGSPMGHEFIGVVEETGKDVSTLKKGAFVIAPFAWSDGTCDFCREGLQRVRELSGGDGTHTVLECVGHRPAYDQALGVIRPGGVISRVGVPQYEDAPIGFGSMFGPNITLTGGPAPSAPTSRRSCPASLTAPSTRARCLTGPSA